MQTDLTRPFIRDKLFIPAKLVNPTDLNRHYFKRFYQEDQCRQCPELPYRHSPECTKCPNYLAQIKMWDEVLVEQRRTGWRRRFVRVPAGDLPAVSRNLRVNLRHAVDQRRIWPARWPLRFYGKLRRGGRKNGINLVDQKQLVDDWWRTKTGVIEAPPRSGKTYMGVDITAELAVRTIITASQSDFLDQFEEKFYQNTDLREQERRGRKIMIRINNDRDLEEAWKYDIVVVNYQKFITPKGIKRIRKYLRGQFSLVICDEAHQGNAYHFARFLNQLDCRYRLGLTATPEREDGMDILVAAILGRVVAKSDVVGLLPQLELLETGFGGNKNYRQRFRALRFLFDDDNARNKLIVRQVFKDLRAHPDHSILLAASQIKHIKWLVNTINRQGQINNIKRGEKWQRNLAVPFYAGVDRKQMRKDAERYYHRVTVARYSMVQHALDVEAWTHVYTGIEPMTKLPMFYQLANRVCTPYRDNSRKPAHVVRMFIDFMPISYYCFRKLFAKIRKHLPGNRSGNVPRYAISPPHYQRAMEIVKHPRVYHPKDANRYTQKPSVRRYF